MVLQGLSTLSQRALSTPLVATNLDLSCSEWANTFEGNMKDAIEIMAMPIGNDNLAIICSFLHLAVQFLMALP